MEKNFLMYLFYSAFIQMREIGNEQKNKTIFHLCDLLHNIPLQLIDDNEGKETYNNLLKDISGFEIEKWILKRKEEFNNKFL